MLAVDWTPEKIIVFVAPFALLAIGALAWALLLRRTIRTRLRTARQLRDDPDINEWIVVFPWSRKVLYVPTVLVSLGAGVAMLFLSPDSHAGHVIGGIWLAVFVLNFLVDEYEINVKVILIAVFFFGAMCLWLLLMGWLGGFFRFFRVLEIGLSAAAYFVLAGLFLAAIGVSWVRGLFYYVAITPNYLNIQAGPTESGEQINHAEYSTQVDTGDFLERLLGFGRIIVTFRDQRRAPLQMLVCRIGRRAQLLESIRGKLAVDRSQPAREGQ